MANHTRGDHPAVRNPKTTSKNLLGWMTVATLAFVLVVWLDLAPGLRGPDEWRWPLRAFETPIRLIVPVAVLALYTVVCVRRLSAESPAGERRFLLFLTLSAPLIQLALAASVSRLPLLEFFGPTVSEHNSGYFNTAVTTPDLNGLLARYPALMPSLPIHAQSHPPGPIVLHWLSWRFFEGVPALADALGLPLRTLQCHNAALMALDNAQLAGALIGMLAPLIGACAVWPMVALGKRLAGGRAALLAAVLFPVMPLFAMWPTQWDQVYPLLLFTSLYFAHTGLEARSVGRAFAAGVPLSIATFFSVGNAVLIAIVGLYGLIWILIQRAQTPNSLRTLVRSWLGVALGWLIGCASVWLIYALLYRVNPLDVIATGSRLAFESTTGNRTYGVWLLWNPIDFAIFLGMPLATLGVFALLNLRRDSLQRPSHSAIVPLAVATLGSLIALDVSGVVRGEVGRLWLYFGPLLALTSLAAIDLTDRRWQAALIGLTAVQLVTLNARWLVSDSFLDEPPERTANFALPNPQVATQASFDRQIALRGYDVARIEDTIDVTLYWQALAQPPHAYTVFVHVLDANGQALGQQDHMPVNDQLPTSCWQPGEVVADPYAVALPPNTAGPLAIDVGLYRLDTLQRLPLDGGAGDSLRLSVP